MLAGAAALVIPLVFLNIPENTRLLQALFNAGHAPLFGAVSLFFLGLSFTLLEPHIERRYWHYVIAAGMAVAFGFGTEYAQIFTGRDAGLDDVGRDIIGTVAVLGITMTYDRKLFRVRRLSLSKVSTMLRTALFILLLSPLVPVAIWAAAYDKRDSMAPYLYRFDSYLGRHFVCTETADLAVVDPPAYWKNNSDGKVGRLSFHKSLYPQMYIDEVYPDWTGYDSLTFDIVLPRSDSAQLTLRINDWVHNQEHGDRFNSSFYIYHGLNHVAIPLADVAHAPLGRPMQMDHIKTVILFCAEPLDSFTVFIGPMLLTK
ncbi:MAG: VanZ family protein [Candidatus Zixiibacteriota bacterium]